ncbi:hypothetical protein GEMRC1_013610 [Eukaryota sp. GEM-RC1]
MIFTLFLLCSSVLASLHQWSATTDGLWSEKNNWDLGYPPLPSSSVVLPPETSSVTVTIDSNVTVVSLTISSSFVLLFQNNSTLTVSDKLVIHGGMFITDIASSLSFTSVDTLVVDTDLVTFSSHKLIVTRMFVWTRGVIDLDIFSELVLNHCVMKRPVTNLISNDKWSPAEGGGKIESDDGVHYLVTSTSHNWSGVIQSFTPCCSRYKYSYVAKRVSGSNILGSHIDGGSVLIRIDLGEWVAGYRLEVPGNEWHLIDFMFDASTASNPRVALQPARGSPEVTKFLYKNVRLEPLSVITGQGKLSLVNSEIELSSTDVELRSISLTSSNLQSNGSIFHDLETLKLYDSIMSLTQDSKIQAGNVSITLHSSALYYDDSVYFASETLNTFTIIRRNDWKPAHRPLPSSSVVIPARTFSITMIISSDVVLTSLKISSNVVLLFQNNAALTVTNSFILNGGTLITDMSSPLSSTSVDSLVVDADLVTFKSQKVVAIKFFHWKRGLIELDRSSELVLNQCISTIFNRNDSEKSSDVLRVWGEHQDGVLGGGLSKNQDFPYSFTLPFSIKQVSAGFHHSLVLSTNGAVYTSGRNNNGRLGYDGPNRDVHKKIEISNVAQVLAGYHSSYVLSVSGSVYSFGGNSEGQLGLGDTTDRLTPTLIPTLNNIIQITGRHREDGSTRTCGKLLGSGSGTQTQKSPTEFSNDIEFTFIDTVWDHALGIDGNQKLWSWGSNDFGQLGNGGSSNSVIPVELKVIGKVITASTGFRHSVAVDVNNDVWSWGATTSGALGRITSTVPVHTPGIVTDLTGKGVTGISAHYFSNFVISSNVPISIFGQGKFSLIDSEVELHLSKFELSSISLTSSVLESNGSIFHDLETLELYDSTLSLTQDSKILRDNVSITLNSSELHYDDSVFFSSATLNYFSIIRRNYWKPAYLPLPPSSVVPPAQTFSITVVISSDMELSSLTISSNVVLLFQNNSTMNVSESFAISGGTLITDMSSPLSSTSVAFLVVDADLVSLTAHKLIVTKFFDWKQGPIGLDKSSELVLTNCTSTIFHGKNSQGSSDVLRVWGDNEYGTFGGGLTQNEHLDLPYSFTLPFRIKQVSAGYYHSLVLSTNGDVYTSGRNDNGRLGDDPPTRNIHKKIEMSNIAQVHGGYHSSYVVSISGSVFSFGGNNVGQLGLGDTEDRHTPTIIPHLQDIKQIAGRYRTMFALTQDGKVFGWGRGVDNILCRPNTASALTPFEIETLQNIKFIAAGRSVSYFIKEDGYTLTCGFYLGAAGTQTSPNDFATNIVFTFIDNIWDHALGIDVYQKLWSWGSNNHGQLGNNVLHTISPVEVKVIGKVLAASVGEYHSVAVDVNNDVWTWGKPSNGALGRITSTVPAHTPGIVTDLTGKGVTGVSAHYLSNFALISFVPVGLFGDGKLSLIDSEVELPLSQFELSSISLTSSNLQSNGTIIHDLETLELHNGSIMSLTEDSKILADNVSITMNSSELYYDDSVYFSMTTLSLIAIKSRFQNDFNVTDFHILDLSFSTFDSILDTEIIVGYFHCYHCQIFGKTILEITSLSYINSGNFSSSLIVQESVTQSSVSGEIKMSRSFDFFSHVILDDVSLCGFQSYLTGSITFYSGVLLRFFCTFSSTSFTSHSDIILSKCKHSQILSGSGVVFDNTSHSGIIIPSSLITFDDNLYLSSYSFVSLKILNYTTSTQLIVGSTLYLDGTLEVEFDPFHHWSGKQFLLISSTNLIGQFNSLTSACSSLIKVKYTSNSVIGSIDDYIADLNEVSYISTSGIDDPCCGTFDSPCASFKGVLERMGRKGKVYLLTGYYYFNKGFGKFTDIDWEVIGVGDVNIEANSDNFFQIDSSSLTMKNLRLDRGNMIFQVFNSSINLVDINIHLSSNSSLFLIQNSTLILADSTFDIDSSRMFDSLESSIFVDNSTFSGTFSDTLIWLSYSSLYISNFEFLYLTTNKFIVSLSSSIELSDSSFLEVVASTMLSLNDSELIFK